MSNIKPKTAKPPSKATLKKAAKLLQAAHDQIAIVGLNIDHYGFDYEVNDGSLEAPMCYIGSVRAVAGVDPSPGFNNDGHTDPGADDGPELILALEAMDKIARRRIQSISSMDYPVTTGRFVEQLGFEVSSRAERRFPIPNQECGESCADYLARSEPVKNKRRKYEKAYALKLLRQALTEIYG